MDNVITAKQAYDLANTNYLEKVNIQYNHIMSSIEEREEAGHMFLDIVAIAPENKTKLLELNYKVTDCDTFVRIGWYHAGSADEPAEESGEATPAGGE